MACCNAEIKLLEGTVVEKKIPNFQFRTNEVFSGNVLEAWESDIMVRLCGGIIAAGMGLSMTDKVSACVEQALIKEIATMSETQKIFMTYDKIDPVDVKNLFEKVLKRLQVSKNPKNHPIIRFRNRRLVMQ